MAKKFFVGLIALVALGVQIGAQTYTLSPAPRQQYFDTANGNVPLAAGKICTYVAGTSTPVFTFLDANGTQNANPVRTDANGMAPIYLAAGSTYKYVVLSCANGACSDTTCATGTTLYTQDNISAVPSGSASVDDLGLAGEAISAGQCVYLSDGSGSKISGRWYKCDTANAYSSVLPEVGIALSAITSGSQGSIRLVGAVSGLSGLTAGAPTYAGAGGALTTTAPGNARTLGVADSSTSLILKDLSAGYTDNGIDDFRLTLTTATPVTTSDVTAATTLFCTPNGHGNRIVLFDSVGNATIYKSAEFSIAVPATTSTRYDVFAFSNAGVPTLELLLTTRTDNTGLTLATTGVYTKTGDLTRRYLGSFATTTVSGQTEDSIAHRLVWNYYNRADRPMRVIDAAASWAYTTNTLRQANANAANQLDFVLGVQEDVVVANVMANAADTTGGVFLVGIGLDSTTTIATGETSAMGAFTANSIPIGVSAMYRSYPGVGRHTLVWLEAVVGGTSTLWFGTSKYQTGNSSGISGTIKG